MRADLLAGPARGLVERGANPVVLAAGVQAGQELGARAMPVMTAPVGSLRGDRWRHFCFLAANECDGTRRASFGEDLVRTLLVCTDMRFLLVRGTGCSLRAL